jgi:hypothetical protein
MGNGAFFGYPMPESITVMVFSPKNMECMDRTIYINEKGEKNER